VKGPIPIGFWWLAQVVPLVPLKIEFGETARRITLRICEWAAIGLASASLVSLANFSAGLFHMPDQVARTNIELSRLQTTVTELQTHQNDAANLIHQHEIDSERRLNQVIVQVTGIDRGYSLAIDGLKQRVDSQARYIEAISRGLLEFRQTEDRARARVGH
jgi:hypothetical protein